ncbi:glutathione S-transferase family protein [Aspergillus mulundensis]|uniref:Glutathione S-transferase-like protein gedE n=1 Tax=Aspergillus mulundensis TaxID=1810919 RepID=A0A3D8QMN9_9EURO|nr:Glutathione S-transferase-like protein gedE [Aspergillus mulundensis]RDW62910.1 Glutathione S-transferase-like protein gedE [Aspergillus mulundensis]
MSFGTLYTHNPTPRSTTLLALAKLNNLDIDIVYAEKKNEQAFAELRKYNPLGQVPTFVGADGLVLSECIPLTLYCTLPVLIPTSKRSVNHTMLAVASQAPNKRSSALLGSSQNDSLKILQWMSFANSDLFPAVGGVFLPRIGRRQIIRQDDEDSLRAMLQRCKYIDEHLKTSRFLVGDTVTIADFFTTSLLMGAFAAFRKTMEDRFQTLCRWYDEVCEVDWFKEIAGGVPDLGLELEIPEDSE